jgi:hypothetical protein
MLSCAHQAQLAGVGDSPVHPKHCAALNCATAAATATTLQLLFRQRLLCILLLPTQPPALGLQAPGCCYYSCHCCCSCPCPPATRTLLRFSTRFCR